MNAGKLRQARVRDVHRLAKWLGIDADRKSSETVDEYHVRLVTSVAAQTRPTMLEFDAFLP